MAKNIEDIIPPERKRSIRNIPIPESRRKNTSSIDFQSSPQPAPPPPPPPSPPPPKNTYSFEPPTEEYDFHKSSVGLPRFSRKRLWILGGLAATLIFVFVLLTIFDGATLSYTPKSTKISFEGEEFSASKAGAGLIFSVIKISKDQGMEVPATGEADVSRKASGVIIVYNNATTQGQKLRATTRFETPEGKIYRTQNDITVPGKKTVAGKEVPGSIEVTVYADVPGAEYNIDLTDFTLPGLKGSSLFSGVYARSKTPMTGGFVGKEKSVSDADRAKATTQLEERLRTELLSEARAQAPDGFVIVPDLSTFTFEELPQGEASNRSNAILNMRGHFEGAMFKARDLSTILAREKASLAPGDLVDILELENVEFSFLDNVVTNPLATEEITFAVSGQGTVVWYTDETALKADLLGRNKDKLNSILNNYPTISDARATIRPFWKSSFPSDGEGLMIKKLEVK